jgi:hypothetical protein
MLALVALAAACTAPRHSGDALPPGDSAGSSGAALLISDTIRGLVLIVGAEPAALPVIQVGTRAVNLAGSTAALRSLDGLEVTAQGRAMQDGSFHVASFQVRALTGIPAVDGILVQENTRFLLHTAAGERLPIAYLPPMLREHLGARVWLAGPLDRSPEAWGIIR